jgi:hypothetical protein
LYKFTSRKLFFVAVLSARGGKVQEKIQKTGVVAGQQVALRVVTANCLVGMLVFPNQGQYSKYGGICQRMFSAFSHPAIPNLKSSQLKIGR